jgi:hypothetical protein
MKKYVLVFILLLSTVIVNAQGRDGTFSIIPRIGFAVSDLTGNNSDIYDASASSTSPEHVFNSKMKAGVAGGVEVEYQANPNVSFSAGVLYSMRGVKYDDYLEPVTSGKTTGWSDLRSNLQYLDVPVLANYYLAKGLAVKGGLTFSYLLDATVKYKMAEVTVEKDGAMTYGSPVKKSNNDNDICNKELFAATVGLSYEYMNVVLDARYSYGINSTYKGWFGKAHDSTLTFMLGYRFQL